MERTQTVLLLQDTGTKRTRRTVHLKHSLRADEEIHALLPVRLDALEDALAHGGVHELRAALDAAV